MMDDIDTGKNILTLHCLHWMVFVSAKCSICVYETSVLLSLVWFADQKESI